MTRTNFIGTTKWTVEVLKAVHNDKYLEVAFGGGHQVNLMIHDPDQPGETLHIALGKEEATELRKLLEEYINTGDD